MDVSLLGRSEAGIKYNFKEGKIAVFWGSGVREYIVYTAAQRVYGTRTKQSRPETRCAATHSNGRQRVKLNQCDRVFLFAFAQE